MRVLHVCKYFFPRITGVTAYVENLGREQLALGHEVAVASWRDADGAPEHHGLRTLKAKAWDKRELAGLMAGFQPDIIHAHSIWETTSLAVKTARSLDRPYVITTHGTWHFLEYTGAYDRMADRLRLGVWRRHVLWPRLLRGAGAVIALNAHEEADALEAGVSGFKVHRIPNAVDVDTFHPADQDEARSRLGWPHGAIVLFVGAMQDQKGLFTALRAAGALENDLVKQWVFCGEGPDLERARAMAETPGLAGKTVFLGKVPRENMPGLYQAADMVVLPSHQEPFATVFLEAMACGLPCVGSADGGTPEIIVDAQTGFLVPPGDDRALAEMVGWLAQHPREAKALGQAGRHRAEQVFAWPGVAQRIEGAYRVALGMLAVLVFLAFSQMAQAVSVVPLDILTMVDPLTAQAVPQPGVGDWRASNPVWDGKTVRVGAAGGESAAFQLVLLLDPEETLEDVRIQVDLTGIASWRAYRAWHIWNVPEVAVPLVAGGPAFDIPSSVPAERAATRGYRAWSTVVELQVPRESRLAHLEGVVRVTWKGGEAQLPLKVDVGAFDLPARPSFEVEMNSYGDYLHHLPASPEMFVKIHKLFREFRCTFTLVPYRQDGSLVLEYLAPTQKTDHTPDFAAFDTALAGLFDGESFSDHQPLSHFILPLQSNWPFPLAGDPAEFAARNVSMRRELVRHIQDKGWTATRFQEFHNENPEAGAKVPWRMDEPASIKDLAGHELFLDLRAKACGEAAGRCPLRYRIDISNWQPLRRELKRMAGPVTDWSVSSAPEFLDHEAVSFFRGLGAQWLVTYGELAGFQTKGNSTPWAWFPERLAGLYLAGVDGYAQWQSDRGMNAPLAGIPPQLAVLFQANAAGARDFMWPGPALGLDGPMPSLRLFAIREGLNILDYFTLAVGRRPDLSDELRARLARLDGAGAIMAFKADLAGIAATGGRLETGY